jgi:survival-of-motor-neuron-related-splicing factor 30
MSSLTQLEHELADAQENVDTCKQAIAMGMADDETQSMKTMLEDQITTLRSQIAALKSRKSTPPPSPPDHATSSTPPTKWDASKHPKYRNSPSDAPPPSQYPPDATTSFNVGDSVQAKYSEDKQWYSAVVLSKTGSSSDPVYTVKFLGYNDKEQKRKHEVRPAENKKRKADSTPAAPAAAVPPPPPPPPISSNQISSGTVISAAPSIDPTLVQKREPSKVSDGPTRMAPAPKKLKGNRTLEKAKSSWNDWQKSGPKKPAVGGATKLKKDSQFRTPDLPNAKGSSTLVLHECCHCTDLMS